MFKPVLRAKPNPLQARERGDQFVNPPTHPEIPTFLAPTDNGGACYPLKLGNASGGFCPTPQRRSIDSSETGQD